MSGIFPLREKIDLGEDREPRLVELDDDVADEVFDALSSRTTRKIFAELHDSPQTASDLAGVTDTSVQNAQYHLEKLVAADLVEVVDTWYSERGTEMNVYAPTDEALVLFAGDDTERSLRALLKRLIGGLAVLLPGSAAVAWLADRFARPETAGTFQSNPAATDDGPEAGSTGDGSDAAAPMAEKDERADDTGAAGGGDDSAGSSSDSGGDSTGSGGSGTTDGTSGGRSGGDGGDGGDGGEIMDGSPDTPADPPEATPNSESTEFNVNADSPNATDVDLRVSDSADPETFEVATPRPEQEAVDTALDAVGIPASRVEPTGVAETAGGIDPALLAGVSFFCGGLIVLVFAVGVWYLRS